MTEHIGGHAIILHILPGGIRMAEHKGTVRLETERLTLRRYELSDAQSIYENYASDGRVTRFLRWDPYSSVEGLEAFLSLEIEKYERPSFYHWAIEKDGAVIGGISAFSIDEKNESCEVGYCIGYRFWNQGLMSEALLAVMDFLFHDVGMRRIIAMHDVENPASGKVMRNCGMTLEGRLRSHYLRRDGSCSDALFYGILREEF